MKFKYLKACQDAGLTPEQIKAIDRIFDDEKKARLAERHKREKYGISFVYLDHLKNDNERSENIQIADPRVNVEEQVFHQMAMDCMLECLAEMDRSDRDFLLECFEGGTGHQAAMAKKYNTYEMDIIRRRRRLFDQLQKNFFKKFGE